VSKSQVSRMTAELDEHVEEFRHRPLDTAGPLRFVAADAFTATGTARSSAYA
jgi:putative transposase